MPRGYNKFKAYLVENAIKQKELASVLNITPSRLNLILNGKRDADFSAGQIKKICDHYQISADEYFF